MSQSRFGWMGKLVWASMATALAVAAGMAGAQQRGPGGPHLKEVDMSGMPQVPYGAVYFRKSNPPREDWDRDYATAAKDGNNVFRHWFLWGAIETSPGVYDWADYDRQMELAEKHGIGTVIAEMTSLAPEWVFHRYPEALYIDIKGARPVSGISSSCITGGHAKGNAGAVCLDTEIGRERVGAFLTALAARYKGHPALLAYDVWNECFYQPDICYCEATREAFVAWLQERYASLEELRQTWRRYSLEDWGQIAIPKQHAPWPECGDWLRFRKDNFYRQMAWRVETLRAVDPNVLITAHGLGNSLDWMFSHGSDHWQAAAQVDSYGFTFVQTREGNDPVTLWRSLDAVRAGAAGKPFWYSEAQGGPRWPAGPNPEGRWITEPEDIRLWHLTSLAGGARGLLYPRWRPLLDGPLFGAYGPYGLDGGRTPRSEMNSRMAQWANSAEVGELMEATPVKGDVGVLFLEESALMSHLSESHMRKDWYPLAFWGTCRGFLGNNIQSDWIRLGDIDRYEVIYLPFPIAMADETAAALLAWVEGGGFLIAEGCPAYFDSNFRARTAQPGAGLDGLFGALETDVRFMPEVPSEVRFDELDPAVRGAGYRQAYEPKNGARALARYEDGEIAAVQRKYGEGATVLVGTHPSIATDTKRGESNRAYFQYVFSLSGRGQQVTLSNARVHARLHAGQDTVFLWVINPTRSPQKTEASISTGLGRLTDAQPLWGNGARITAENTIELTVQARDAVVLQLTALP